MKKGDKVRITGNTCDHNFEIGEVVEYKGEDNLFTNGQEVWSLHACDYEPIKPDLTVEEVREASNSFSLNAELNLFSDGSGSFNGTKFSNIQELTDLIRKPKRTVEDVSKNLIENWESKNPNGDYTDSLMKELKTLLK